MTTTSTAGMIAAVREAAHMTKTQEERDVLNGIANRVEMLAEANSIKSLELDSIRQALKIPGSDSVQAGTIAAFCKLQSDLQEVTALANRLRRTAKDYQEENQQVRSEQEEAIKQKPFMHGIADPGGNPYFDECCVGDAGLMNDQVANLNDDLEEGEPRYSVVELFRNPVPVKLIQPYMMPDALLSAMEEVIHISDRDHEAWDRAKAAISSCRAVSEENRDGDE